MFDFISPQEWTFLLMLLVSLGISVVIGIERELRGKDAGISTNAFVIIGAMLFTFLSQHVDSESTTRIAANIVSGIGFLGAGIILKDGANVRNLTTAASIWLSAAIGMAIGFEYYLVALLATVAAVIVPRIPRVK